MQAFPLFSVNVKKCQKLSVHVLYILYLFLLKTCVPTSTKHLNLILLTPFSSRYSMFVRMYRVLRGLNAMIICTISIQRCFADAVSILPRDMSYPSPFSRSYLFMNRILIGESPQVGIADIYVRRAVQQRNRHTQTRDGLLCYSVSRLY